MSAPHYCHRQSAPHTVHICPFHIRSLPSCALSRSAKSSRSINLVLATQTWPTQSFPASEQPREHSQLRRGGHSQPANERRNVVSHAEDGRRSNRRAKEDGLPSSLYVQYGKLPPDGKSIFDEEALCNPEEQRCKTPVHIWEKKCSACYGTGQIASRSRRGHRHSYTCLACHGLGFVRRASSTQIPDFGDGAMTVGRDKEDGDEPKS